MPDPEDDDLPGIEVYYLQMIDRMKTIFVDYSYQRPEILELLDNGNQTINFNALTIVLNALNKIY